MKNQELICRDLIIEFNMVYRNNSKERKELLLLLSELCVGIKSVSIALHSAKDSSLGIANEIANFLEYHRVDVTGYNSDNIFQYWNSVYNTHFISPNECIAEYLRIVYDLWFEDEVALQEVLKDNLYKHIKMERRVCTTQDVQFFREFHGQPWFDPNVINRYSTTVTVTKFTDTVRKQGKLTAEVYNAFVQKLDAEDVLFNIDMTYAKQVYNPTGNESSVLTEDCYYTQDLLDGLFSSGERGKVVDGKDDGVVYFSKDDTFTVHVTNRSETIGQKFKKFLPWYANSSSTNIDACSGGLIRDEEGK